MFITRSSKHTMFLHTLRLLSPWEIVNLKHTNAVLRLSYVQGKLANCATPPLLRVIERSLASKTTWEIQTNFLASSIQRILDAVNSNKLSALSIQRILEHANLCHAHRSSRDSLAISNRLLTSGDILAISARLLTGPLAISWRYLDDICTLHNHCNSDVAMVGDILHISKLGDGYLQFELNWNASLN